MSTETPAVSTPLLPYLRPPGWPHLDQVPHHPLVEIEGVPMPAVTYVYTHDAQVRPITHEALLEGGLSVAELAAEATLNLAQRPMELTPQPLADVVGGMIITVTDEFAAEAITCPPLMHAAHDALGTDQIAVALPARGVLLIGDGRPEGHPEILSAWAREVFVDAGPQGLTPQIFVLRLGVPEGIFVPGA